jgi:MYXO-CTERM domain-containing protein
LSFTTLANAPSVTTGSATLLTGTTAQLNGSGNPGGAATTAWFRYATASPGTCNDTFGTRAPATGGSSLGSGTTTSSYSQAVTGLSAGTTYFYCAIAQNSVGTAVGLVQSFTTPLPPTVTTSAAINITNIAATFQGTGTPNGASTTGWFRYSLTNPGSCNDTFGSRAPTSGGSTLGTGNSPVSFSQSVASLSPGTTYYFCAIASSPEGIAFGSILSFTTPHIPTTTTAAATVITSSSAALNGSADPNGDPAFGYFRYATVNPGSCGDGFGTRAPPSSINDSSLGGGTTDVPFTRGITGLSPGTTYFYCAIARNGYGNSYGTILSFTTLATQPSVTTSSATAVTTTSATLNATSNPNGAGTTGWFRYASASPGTCNDTFGTRAPATGGTALGAGTSATPFSQGITGLTPGTTYYFCAIAENPAGMTLGNVVTFTTTSPPTVNTFAATPVTATTATLNGNVNPNGFSTSGWFRYGTSDPGSCNASFGTATSSTPLGSGSSFVALAQPITDLLPATTYFFCAFASSSIGTTLGEVLSFTTPAAPPSVTTSAASSVSNTSATLNASVSPNGSAAIGWFRYSPTNPGTCNDLFGTRLPVSGGTALGSGSTPVSLSLAASGLTAGTTYYYCALSSSSVGTSVGLVLSFTTASLPTTTTSSATAVTSAGATLQGSANPNFASTTGWFRYSASNPGACDDTFGTRAPATGGSSLGAGSAVVPYSQPVTGLASGTTYFFCAIAENVAGKGYGAVMSFTTAAVPTVTTAAATAVTNNQATVNGSANPNLLSTTGWYRYDTVNPGTCNDTFGTRAPTTGGTALGAGSAPAAYARTLTGLSAATTYYYCAIASNSAGSGFGEVMSFTTAAAPSVTTAAATSVTSSGATLNGAANPNLLTATGWFRYSSVSPGTCNDTFGTRAPSSGGTALGAGSSAVDYAQPVTGLAGGTTYFYCAIASNSAGTRFGSVMSFTTLAVPTVTTSAASAVSSTGATLNGSANPRGSDASGWFRYHTVSPGTCNDTFGTRTPSSGGTALGAGGSAVPYQQPITGLAPGTTYFVCAIAQNGVGTGVGSVQSFTTPAAPTVTTSAPSALSSTGATLNGSGDPNLDAATGWFRYSSTDPGSCNDTFGTRAPASGGTSLGAGGSAVAYSQAVTGLTSGTTYYFCAIASNSVGTSFGTLLSFTTAAAPAVTTAAATSVATTTATVNGSANPNLLSATGWFRYSATDPGSCNDTFGTRAPASGGTALGAGGTPVSYSRSLTGLTSGTTYYYCAIASNSAGTGFGGVLSFTTSGPPVVTTSAASAVTSSGATLNGSANPNLVSTTGWFRYSATNPGSCNDAFGTRAPASGGAALGAGSTPVAYAQPVSGLSPATTYYVCAIASSTAGTAFGSVMTFTTPAAPVVTTSAATSVASTTATLNGSANPRLSDATGWFRYSATNPGSCNDSFGTRAPASGGTALGNGSSPVAYSEALTGLSAGTTYFFCAIAQNGVGTSFGSVMSLTTTAAPSVTTGPATAVSSAAALLNGSANPMLLATTGWFRYATSNPGTCNDTFGTRAPASGGAALGSGSSPVDYSQALTGLAPLTTYFYCAIGSNSVGTSFGAVMSFTTPGMPIVTSEDASAVSSSTATINGTVIANASDATAWFRYATSDPGDCDDSFGTRAPASGGTTVPASVSAEDVSEAIDNLAPGTTYYFCAIAENDSGLGFGEVVTFTTEASLPSVTTDPATQVTDDSAQLNGAANPNAGATSGWFRYATSDPGDCDDSFGTRLPASGGTALGDGIDPVAYSEDLGNLDPGVTYYFCAIAENAQGIGFGEVRSFVSGAAPPSVTTEEAADVMGGSATLQGSATPNGSATTGWFRLGDAAPSSCDDSFGARVPESGGVDLGAGTTSEDFAQALTELEPHRTYYYCAAASNDAGAAFGEVLSFTTGAVAPVVHTNAAENYADGKMLNGSANPMGSESTAWFRYDSVDPGQCNDSFGTRAPIADGTALGSGRDDVAFNEPVVGDRLPGTYYYCAIAQNEAGIGYGEVMTFKIEGGDDDSSEDEGCSIASPPRKTRTNMAVVLLAALLVVAVRRRRGTRLSGWRRPR